MADTRFKKGASGNPGGRPVLPEDVKNRIKALTPKAIDALESALRSDDDRTKMAAATALLDRAWGKPAQQTDLTVNQSPEPGMSQADLLAWCEVVKRAAERPDET
jgi:hypothetical protein